MQENIYIAKKGRIIRQSFFIWLFSALHITSNIFGIPPLLRHNQIWAIFLINLMLGIITIPSLIIFFRYYKHSINKKFVVTYNSLKFIDHKTGQTTELINSEINKIFLATTQTSNNLPWCFHEYFSFEDEKGNKIIVTSYIMDIVDFWLDSLSRKVSSNKLVRVEKTFPLFKIPTS